MAVSRPVTFCGEKVRKLKSKNNDYFLLTILNYRSATEDRWNNMYKRRANFLRRGKHEFK